MMAAVSRLHFPPNGRCAPRRTNRTDQLSDGYRLAKSLTILSMIGVEPTCHEDFKNAKANNDRSGSTIAQHAMAFHRFARDVASRESSHIARASTQSRIHTCRRGDSIVCGFLSCRHVHRVCTNFGKQSRARRGDRIDQRYVRDDRFWIGH
jgi:hypothetical protein